MILLETADIVCLLVVVFVGLAFTIDCLGAGFSALRKKEYKSIIGSFIENLSDRKAVWWFPILIAVLFVYGLINL